jgi:hypothetical protein
MQIHHVKIHSVLPRWIKQDGQFNARASKPVPLLGYTAKSQVQAWNVGNNL